MTRTAMGAGWRSFLMCSILLVCASGSRFAHADAYEAALARAVAARERALDRNDPAEWEEALLRFEEADQIRSTKETQYELAFAAERLRQYDLAVEAYETAIGLGLDGSALDKARSFLQTTGSSMARVRLVGPVGTQVFIGRRRRAVLPLAHPLVLFPGISQIRAAFRDREIVSTLRLEAGAETYLDLTTSLLSPPPSSSSRPADSPIRPESRVSPGWPGSSTQPPRGDRTLGWTLVGIGAGMAAIGTGLVIGSSFVIPARRDTLSDQCAVRRGLDDCVFAQPGQQQGAQSTVDSIATWKAVRTVGWITAGTGIVGVSTGGWTLLAHPKPKQVASRWSIAMPTPLPDGVLCGISGVL